MRPGRDLVPSFVRLHPRRSAASPARLESWGGASLELELLRDASRDRMGDVLLRQGAKVVGSPARGRATCPVHGGDGLNTSFANGFATCHSGCGGVTRDALRLVADVAGRDLHHADDLKAAALNLAEILGVRLDVEDAHPRARGPIQARSEPRTTSAPPRDVEAIWSRLALRDDTGEAYLRSRRLLGQPMPDELVRFNRGSGDLWLEARERDGFVVAFAVRRVDGTLATISLRYVGEGDPPAPWKKSITLKGASTSGAAICRAGIALLATGDTEFANDEIVLVEGGTDALAVTIAFDLSSIEGVVPPTWALGAIGCGSAPATVLAFAPVVRGRTVHVALDVDSSGEESVPRTVAAAWAAEATRVTRLRSPAGKDVADAWRTRE